MNEKNRFEEIILSTLNDLRQDFNNLRQDFTDLRKDVTDLRKEVSDLKTDVGWIKGKLEGRAETRHVVLTGISIFIAIAAVVVAILK